MRYCTSCGTQLSSETTQCPKCGATIPAYDSNREPTSDAPTIASSPPGTPQPPSIGSGPQHNPVTPQNPYGTPPSSPHTSYPSNISPNTPLPLPAQHRSNRIGIIVGVILLLLLLVGSGVFVYARSSAQNAALQATATAQARATVQARVTAVTPASNPYTHTGTLAFSDPLSDNSKGHGWSEYAANCAFKAGAYHVMAPNIKYNDYCMASKIDIDNFAFEVQMQIIQGDGGAIYFRAAPKLRDNDYYVFRIYRNGLFNFAMYRHNQPTRLASGDSASGNSLVFNQELNQINLLAAVVQGTSIKMYVNHKLIVSTTDSTYSHGQIGVGASPGFDHPTEVVYSNLKMWKL